MNNADKKVNMYACRNATNNSKQLNAAEPSTAIAAVKYHCQPATSGEENGSTPARSVSSTIGPPRPGGAYRTQSVPQRKRRMKDSGRAHQQRDELSHRIEAKRQIALARDRQGNAPALGAFQHAQKEHPRDHRISGNE